VPPIPAQEGGICLTFTSKPNAQAHLLVLQVDRCRTVTEEKHYAKLTVLAHGNVTPALSFIRREFERHGTAKRHKE